MKALIVATLLIASPAAAQTTTTCTQLGVYVNCNTSAPPPAPPVVVDNSAAQAQSLNNSMYQLGTVIRERREAQQRAQLQSQMADMIGAGDCRGAVALAMRAGDMQMAATAAQVCPQ